MSAYDQMARAARGDLSAVEILGELTQPVEHPAIPGRYTDQAYNTQDQIDFGLDSAFHPQTTVNATGQVLAGAVASWRTPVSTPFKPIAFQVDSAVAVYFSITFLKIGSTVLLDGDPIPASNYSEVSNYGSVDWPTLQPAMNVEISVQNVGLLPHRFRAAIKGKRLR